METHHCMTIMISLLPKSMCPIISHLIRNTCTLSVTPLMRISELFTGFNAAPHNSVLRRKKHSGEIANSFRLFMR